MSLIDVAILSIVQGVTEFLPISSSGHLVLTQTFLRLKEVPIIFDLVLHLGTACATVLVFYRLIGEILRDILLWLTGKGERKEISRKGTVRLAVYIVISTAVTGVLGLLFRDTIKEFFYRPLAVSLFLFLTGIVLFITRFVQDRGKQISEMGFHAPLIIGCAQTFAMLPGISRSGTTISAGLYLGMERSLSGSFSFLLSIPSILGASLVEFIQANGGMQSISGGQNPLLLTISGFSLSLLTGYGALRLLLSFLGRGKLYIFSYYCFTAAIAIGFLLLAYS